MTISLRAATAAFSLGAGLALMLPASASAADAPVYDSGTPTSGSLGLALSAIDGYAEELHLDAGTTIGGLSTFLVGAQVGETFTIALYGDFVKPNGTELPDTRSGVPLFSTQVTFTGDGWNGANGLAWNVGSAGDYWFAVQVADGDTLDGSDNAYLPVGVPNAPLSVAYTDSVSGRFQPLGAASAGYAFGLQVSAVPEPASLVLAMAGALLLAARQRRGRSRD